MMRVQEIKLPVFVIPLNAHKFIKGQLLSLIESSNKEIIENDKEKIKTDWYLSNQSKEYSKTFIHFFEEQNFYIFKQMDYDRLDYGKAWFQQYELGGEFQWHRHACSTWNVVYYLELPDGTPTTEFKNPLNGEVFTVDAKEGDVVIFPSMLFHRSPVNLTDKRKTIIALNID